MIFFFNDTATTEIYTLSLHDALPIFLAAEARRKPDGGPHQDRNRMVRESLAQHRDGPFSRARGVSEEDRKSTRLNSSHGYISYAVFCLKKKKNNRNNTNPYYEYNIDT